MEKEKLYIPKGAKDTSDWWPGFGFSEFKDMFIPNIIGFISTIVIFAFTKSPFISTSFAISFVSANIMFISKNMDGVSILDFLTYIYTFQKTKKDFKYIYLEEDLRDED